MNNCEVYGTEMDNFEGYDTEYYGDLHEEYVRAYCPHCKKWYKWIEVFTFSHCEGFEEDNQSSFLILF